MLRMGQLVHDRATFASRGLPAGDIFNGVCFKAYQVQAFDGWVERNPLAIVSSYV